MDTNHVLQGHRGSECNFMFRNCTMNSCVGHSQPSEQEGHMLGDSWAPQFLNGRIFRPSSKGNIEAMLEMCGYYLKYSSEEGLTFAFIIALKIHPQGVRWEAQIFLWALHIWKPEEYMGLILDHMQVAICASALVTVPVSNCSTLIVNRATLPSPRCSALYLIIRSLEQLTVFCQKWGWEKRFCFTTTKCISIVFS